MAAQLQTKEQTLVAVLSGEIDHHTAKTMRMEIDREIELSQPETLVLDFSGVTFMDSSGIGLILGRHRMMDAIGGKVTIQSPPSHIRRVMHLSGIERIVTICK